MMTDVLSTVDAATRDRAHGRTPVAMTKDVLPIVACRDGSVWQLVSLPADEEGEVRIEEWRRLPPIPGSVSALRGDRWKEEEGAR